MYSHLEAQMGQASQPQRNLVYLSQEKSAYPNVDHLFSTFLVDNGLHLHIVLKS